MEKKLQIIKNLECHKYINYNTHEKLRSNGKRYNLKIIFLETEF